jgi:hypothetical protein
MASSPPKKQTNKKPKNIQFSALGMWRIQVRHLTAPGYEISTHCSPHKALSTLNH